MKEKVKKPTNSSADRRDPDDYRRLINRCGAPTTCFFSFLRHQVTRETPEKKRQQQQKQQQQQQQHHWLMASSWSCRSRLVQTKNSSNSNSPGKNNWIKTKENETAANKRRPPKTRYNPTCYRWWWWWWWWRRPRRWWWWWCHTEAPAPPPYWPPWKWYRL